MAIITGTNNPDILTGTTAADTINGLAGDDILYGAGNGADIFNGGAGNDTMIGGVLNDLYYVDSSLDVIVEAAASGYDYVYSSANYVLADNLEYLLLQGAATTGTGNALANTLVGNANANVLTGNDGNDSLYGYAGNDTLNGGSGSDYMAGGVDNDSYIVDSAGDTVYEAAAAGTDTVSAYVNYTLGAEVERLYLYGSAISGTGNALANLLNGNANGNVLNGLDGNDSMYGQAGADSLYGGNGNDYLNGGTENDYLRGDAGVDALYGDAGNDTLLGGTENDALYGGAGADNLDGGTGADTMTGGTENDIYTVDNTGDVVVEAAAAGTDRVNTTLTSYTLGAEVENLYLYAASAANGYGNALDNYIAGNSFVNNLYGYDGNDNLSGQAGADVLSGGNGNDTLSGGTENDSLYGGAGADALDGGAGNDTMVGGTENDTYTVDSVSDIVSELAAQGTDRVNAYVNLGLSANVENLYLYGTATVGAGNALGNLVAGNSNANSLYGYDANDGLYGYDGNDYLVGGTGNDNLYGGIGQDRLVLAERGATNRDFLADFSHADDTIVLRDPIDGSSNSAIAGLQFSGGVLSSSYYFEGAGFSGNAAANLSGIYVDTTTGNIYYNPTSTVAGDSLVIALVGVATATSLDNTDFVYSA